MALTDKLTAIADAIRAKTGETGGLTLEQMPTAIASIETGGGGGSVDGYCTVTFMNGDTVLFSRMVLAGDDCPDPYVQSRIELPTKESTAQYTYTFNGWATADGGSADSNALKGITEDKVLYAAFAESVRMYTIRFYDGDTLLNTEQVAYGGSSSYEYSKSGYIFRGWTPSPWSVTADMDCIGKWEESLEIIDSWDTIVASVNDGTYASKYKIGQYKPLDLGTEGVINMQIVGMNGVYTSISTSTDAGGNAKAVALDFVAMNLLNTKQPLHNGSFSSNSDARWGNCSLRTYLTETIYPLLPIELQGAILEVLKKNRYGGSSSNTVSSREKLWIPSRQEVTGNYSVELNCTPVYSSIYVDDASRKKSLANGTASDWWTRSCASTTGIYISSSGSATSTSFSSAKGVCIGFCI